jgi:hypothetical protein
MSLTKLIILIIILNLIGSLFKRLQKKSRQKQLMEKWEREEAGQEGEEPMPGEEPPPPLEEPQDALAKFFEKLRERTEPSPEPAAEPARAAAPPPSAPKAISSVWETPDEEAGPDEEAVPDEEAAPSLEAEDAYKVAAASVPEEDSAAELTREPDQPLEGVLAGSSLVQQGIIMREILGPPKALQNIE